VLPKREEGGYLRGEIEALHVSRTVVAIAGEEYVVVAGDTRKSSSLSILTRGASKVARISDSAVFAASGFDGDLQQLQKILKSSAIRYRQRHGRQMGASALAQMLSNTLYFKRFFPYYAFCLVAGIDGDGRGCVYTFDAIGSKERTGYHAAGSGDALIKPVLDNQLQTPSPLLHPPQPSTTTLSREDAVDVVKDVFAGAGERDIFTGDGVELLMLSRDGSASREVMPLKQD
jgi:20S proteasome subunit beta 6